MEAETNENGNENRPETGEETRDDTRIDSRERNRTEIRSAEVRDIVGRVPRWTLRWGATAVLLALVILFAGSWFFQYPDVIPAGIEVITVEPPILLRSKTGGLIEELLISDGQAVSRGDHLIVIASAGDYGAVVRLRAELEAIDPRLRERDAQSGQELDLSLDFPPGSLGELQSAAARFNRVLADFNDPSDREELEQRLDELFEKKDLVSQLFPVMETEKDLLEEIQEIFEKAQQKFFDLVESEFGAALELDQMKREAYRNRIELVEIKTRVVELQIRICELERSINELRRGYHTKRIALQRELQESYELLWGALVVWEDRHVLEAPVDGTVALLRFFCKNQQIEVGESAVAVVPAGAEGLIGRMELPIPGSGKVARGQRVKIFLSNYPEAEFGLVEGVVSAISRLPDRECYIVEVALPQGLTTSFGEELPSALQLHGTAEIVTGDVRLLERMIGPLRVWITR